MTTHTIQRIERINPEEHAQLLLGFLGTKINNLSPKEAVEELHYEVLNSSNFRLEELATLTATYFSKIGSVDPNQFENIQKELSDELRLMKENWVRRQLRRL